MTGGLKWQSHFTERPVSDGHMAAPADLGDPCCIPHTTATAQHAYKAADARCGCAVVSLHHHKMQQPVKHHGLKQQASLPAQCLVRGLLSCTHLVRDELQLGVELSDAVGQQQPQQVEACKHPLLWGLRHQVPASTHRNQQEQQQQQCFVSCCYKKMTLRASAA